MADKRRLNPAESRKDAAVAVLERAAELSIPEEAAFVTVYIDRRSRPAGRAVRELAWRSFAWSVSELEQLFQFHGVPPRVILVANSGAQPDHATACRAANREIRVSAERASLCHSATLTRLIATAVMTCCKRVFANPI